MVVVSLLISYWYCEQTVENKLAINGICLLPYLEHFTVKRTVSSEVCYAFGLLSGSHGQL